MSWCTHTQSLTCKIVTSNTPPKNNSAGGGIGAAFNKTQEVPRGKQLMLKTQSQISTTKWENLIGSGASSSDRLRYSKYRR